MAINPCGNIVKFKYGSKENLQKIDKELQKVEFYVDNDGIFYVVPIENKIEYVPLFDL